MKPSKLAEVELGKIVTEESYRLESLGYELTENIKKLGLREPLRVESVPNSDRYLLIHGYRRFASLQEFKAPTDKVLCIVEQATNPIMRLFKRLESELMTKRRTGFEIERMVHDLLDKELTVRDIATQLLLSEKTIQQYINSAPTSAAKR